MLSCETEILGNTPCAGGNSYEWQACFVFNQRFTYLKGPIYTEAMGVTVKNSKVKLTHVAYKAIKAV